MIWKTIKEPYPVSDGLLIQVFTSTDGQDWAAWVVSKDDGYYYKSFLGRNSLLEGPFQTIEAVTLACVLCV